MSRYLSLYIIIHKLKGGYVVATTKKGTGKTNWLFNYFFNQLKKETFLFINYSDNMKK